VNHASFRPYVKWEIVVGRLTNCQYGRDGGRKLIKTAQSEESVRSGVVELRAVSNIDQFERGEGEIMDILFHPLKRHHH
jgi:hypothetical protein